MNKNMYQHIGEQPEGRIVRSGYSIHLSMPISLRAEIQLYCRGQITKEGLNNIKRALDLMIDGFPSEEEVCARERQKELLSLPATFVEQPVEPDESSGSNPA